MWRHRIIYNSCEKQQIGSDVKSSVIFIVKIFSKKEEEEEKTVCSPI